MCNYFNWNLVGITNWRYGFISKKLSQKMFFLLFTFSLKKMAAQISVDYISVLNQNQNFWCVFLYFRSFSNFLYSLFLIFIQNSGMHNMRSSQLSTDFQTTHFPRKYIVNHPGWYNNMDQITNSVFFLNSVTSLLCK